MDVTTGCGEGGCVWVQYCRPFSVVRGRTRRGLPSLSEKDRVLGRVGSLLPVCCHAVMCVDEDMTCEGERMVSVA